MKFLALFLTILSSCCLAELEPRVTVEWISGSSDIRSGEPLHSVIKMKISKGWHTYWKNPGDIGLSYEIDANLPEGWTLGDIQYPKPKRITAHGFRSFIYEGDVLFPITMTPTSKTTGPIPEITATLSWLTVNDVMCIQEKVELRLSSAADPKTVDAAYLAIPNALPGAKLTILDTGEHLQITLTLPADSELDPTTFEVFPANRDIVSASSELKFKASPTSPTTWICIAEKSEHLTGEIESFSLELFKIGEPSWSISMAN